MKRTVLVAIMVIAIVAGVVAYASALSDNGTSPSRPGSTRPYR